MDRAIDKARLELLAAISKLVKVGRDSRDFGGREQGAIVILEAAAMDYPTNPNKLVASVRLAHRVLGAPGDFGYSTPEGCAMQDLYQAFNLLVRCIDGVS